MWPPQAIPKPIHNPACGDRMQLPPQPTLTQLDKGEKNVRR
jgi:hypothetical protein